jgi:hypothetical protein
LLSISGCLDSSVDSLSQQHSSTSTSPAHANNTLYSVCVTVIQRSVPSIQKSLNRYPHSPIMHDIASLPLHHMSCVADRIYSDYALGWGRTDIPQMVSWPDFRFSSAPLSSLHERSLMQVICSSRHSSPCSNAYRAESPAFI